MLPSGVAELVLKFGVLVFACLLTIRLIRRIAPRTSLAATSMAIVFVLVGSNAPYLWSRTNFYSIPCAASLLLSTLGLWLWLGGLDASPSSGPPRRRAVESWGIWPAGRCASPRTWGAAPRSRWWRCWGFRCSGRS